MFSPSHHGAPNIALITVICGWTFTAVAALTVGLHFWSARFVPRTGDLKHIGICYTTTYAAFGTTVALVAQITWAIVDEDQGKHIEQVPRTHTAVIIRVGSPKYVPSFRR